MILFDDRPSLTAIVKPAIVAWTVMVIVVVEALPRPSLKVMTIV